MLQLAHFIEDPRRCSYLPRETASLEVRAIVDMTPTEYGHLLARGYRRFGWQVFRPACPSCRQCRSVRVLTQRFEPNASERRVLRKNQKIRAEMTQPNVTPQHVALYNTYQRFMHEHRGWPLQQTTERDYVDAFLSGAGRIGRQWMFYEADRLTGIALMDEVPGAISLVYCFYDPAWRARSPGTFAILTQLLDAKARKVEYAYLGYWIEACPSMSYKGRFQPRQIRSDSGVWE